MTTTPQAKWDGVKPEMLDMFEEAEAKGLWFFTSYQHLWWSPGELARDQREGRFRWDQSEFELRDPQERASELKKEARKARAMLDRFLERIRNSRDPDTLRGIAMKLHWIEVRRSNGRIKSVERLKFVKRDEWGKLIFESRDDDCRHTIDPAVFPRQSIQVGPHETLDIEYYWRGGLHLAQAGDIAVVGFINHEGQRKDAYAEIVGAGERSLKITGSDITFRRADGQPWGSVAYSRGRQLFEIYRVEENADW